MFAMNKQKIRLKLKAFDHKLLDKCTRDIVMTVKKTGANISGPIPMPLNRNVFTVNKSPHVDKKSREQFEIRTHSRLLIIDPSAETVDALMHLDLASGVEVDIKLSGEA